MINCSVKDANKVSLCEPMTLVDSKGGLFTETPRTHGAKAQAHTSADDDGHHHQEAQNHLVAVAQAILRSWAAGCSGPR